MRVNLDAGADTIELTDTAGMETNVETLSVLLE
jgi:hypothetical protein